MRDVLGPGTILGYCTNVHAGATFGDMRANLERYALTVRQRLRLGPEEDMGLGLWCSASVAAGLDDGAGEWSGRKQWLGEWLCLNYLVPFTFNAFPFGDFHGAEVKLGVYEPDWTRPERSEYTQHVASLRAVLFALQAEPGEGSISTLPVGWQGSAAEPALDLAAAARALVSRAAVLATFVEAMGVVLHVDLEPEPGCILQRADDVVRFYEGHVLRAAKRLRVPEQVIRRHLRVCHDICHSAVMFEDQGEALRKYQAAGIGVGKVQISSAVRVRFDEMDTPARAAALAQLRAFQEPRYLHQTVIRDAAEDVSGGGGLRFYEDLPDALAAVPEGALPSGEWRVHFHVPIFLDRFGLLETTQDQIMPAVRLAARELGTKHFEVETYAWGVLPEELRQVELAEGIARELVWVKEQAGLWSPLPSEGEG